MTDDKKSRKEFRTYDEYLKRFFPCIREEQEGQEEKLRTFGASLAHESLKKVRPALIRK